MKLTNEPLNNCDWYIPITEDTIGYIQLTSEFHLPGEIDIDTLKIYYINPETGVETQINALNKIVQYLGNNDFRLLIQGLYGIESDKFYFKIKAKGLNGNEISLYTPTYKKELCRSVGVLIPCLVDGQTHDINGNFIEDISGSIVYQSWQTNETKKYTPVAFLRNVSFNRKSNTIEYKKLNNKPLRTTLKRDYLFRGEPIPSWYLDYLDAVFSFGKVNILGTTYAMDSYSVDVLDEKDCCSFYKITATAYDELKLRLQCSNNCVVLSPIDCGDVEQETNLLIVDICEEFILDESFIYDITDDILEKTGLDISEINAILGTQNDDGIQIQFVNGRYEVQFINDSESGVYFTEFEYEICGEMNKYRVQLNVVEDCVDCLVNTLSSVSFANPNFTLIGNFVSPYFIEFSTDGGVNWNRLPTEYPIGTSVTFTGVPLGVNVMFRVVSVCNEILISETIEYVSPPCECFQVNIFVSEVDVVRAKDSNVIFSYIDCEGNDNEYIANNYGSYSNQFCTKSGNSIIVTYFDITTNNFVLTQLSYGTLTANQCCI
jgi:hypothetical protein